MSHAELFIAIFRLVGNSVKDFTVSPNRRCVNPCELLAHNIHRAIIKILPTISMDSSPIVTTPSHRWQFFDLQKLRQSLPFAIRSCKILVLVTKHFLQDACCFRIRVRCLSSDTLHICRRQICWSFMVLGQDVEGAYPPDLLMSTPFAR